MPDFQKYAKRILIGGSIIVLILMMADFNNRMTELNRLTNQQERVAAESTALFVTEQALETQIAYAGSDAAVEAWAYEQERLAREGENLVVPIPAGGQAPTPIPAGPEEEREPASNWDVWRALFFDG